MTKKKIFLLLGNPDPDTFSGGLSDTYEQAARSSGHELRRMNIGEMHFDPILHMGYKNIQELEPDLVTVQDNIRWADHFVVIYPNWWCTMPAILKGMFDRMWLPGFAFNFDKKTRKLIKRLKGKTARVIIVSGTHSPLAAWFKFGDFTNEISRGILGFSGMDVKVSAFGPCEKCDDDDRSKWKRQVSNLAKRGE
jgi:NAD(P)H dehydrogenase (quinone)